MNQNDERSEILLHCRQKLTKKTKKVPVYIIFFQSTNVLIFVLDLRGFFPVIMGTIKMIPME